MDFRVPCDIEVGSDNRNRAQLGVVATKVHKLGSDILFWGWSDEETRNAMCIGAKPGDATLIEFNENLVVDSGGLLPAVDRLKMSYFAISCNHTVWFLKSLAAKMPSDDPQLPLDGHLSLAQVESVDATFAKRAREGVKWTVLDWRVREHYPQIVALLIEARNGPGEINQRKSVFEVLKEIHTIAGKSEKQHGSTQWEYVRKIVSRTKPPCQHMLDELTAYVVTCGGGSEGKPLDELLRLVRNCGLETLSRNVPAKFWKALADSGTPDGQPTHRLKTCVF